jgi:hypothetical protein
VPYLSRQGFDVIIGFVRAVREFALAIGRCRKNLCDREPVFGAVKTDLAASFVDAPKD